MQTGYTSDVVEGKIDSLRDFAHICARAFFYDIEKLPKTAKELNKMQQSERNWSKEIKELEDAYEEAKSSDAFLEALKKKKTFLTDTLNKMLTENERINSMTDKVMGWTPNPKLDQLKTFMLGQLAESEHNCNHIEKEIRRLDQIIEQHSKDPSSFEVAFKQSLKNKKQIIDSVKKEAESVAESEKEIQAWLDTFFAEFPAQK